MNQFQEIFDKQKAYFDSDATKSYEWRIDQLTRLENLCNENAEALEAAMSSDFKTASQEKVFEIMAPVGTPTVIYPVTWDDPIMEDEIFGPLLPILTYKDMDAAIREVKKHSKPLSGFLFSRDQQAIDHFLASLSFGGGAINQVNIHLFIETMPFGGVGYSGIGHYYGKAGFDALTHAKSVLISPPDVAIEHLFPPYTEEKVKALSQWFEY